MELNTAAQAAVTQYADVQSDETVVIVTDHTRENIADALYQQCLEKAGDVLRVQYPEGNQHGEEPPTGVADVLQAADVFFAPTAKSITHTQAVHNAVETGTRGATLPAVTEQAFNVGMQADLTTIQQNCQDLYEQVRNADELTYQTDNGTEITVEPRYWNIETGDVRTAGEYANLPCGEIFTAPQTANGTIVFDGSLRPHGKLTDTVTVEVEDGQVTYISDIDVRSMFESASEEAGDAVYNLAEVALGANPAVTALSGNILLDEKAAGTAHIAIGDNSTFGGNVEAPIHQDGVLKDPEIYADGELVTLPESHD